MTQKPSITQQLDLLVKGITELKDNGRFNEPNLDGTPGDYISFDSWEWPQGVGLFGLVRLWESTQSDSLKSIIESWFERRITAGLPKLNINTTAPMLPLALLWSHTRDRKWEKVLHSWADDVMTRSPRTPEKGFQHVVSDGINENELWDDTLFMVALFLACFGTASGRKELVEESIRQFLVHAKYLTDPVTGLWFHGWSFNEHHNFAKARWARGNAWITAGIVEFLEFSKVEGALKEFFIGTLEAQVNALLKYQAPSGAWHTLLDDETSYEEISATAGIAYGLLKASRLGIGNAEWEKAGLRAVEAVRNNIDESGTVLNVSYGTRMGRDLQFYRDIPIQPTGYGQALTILCLAEASLHHIED
ncbi:MAG: glycoside hydrolase family 88 protein [Formivibrio sp.]|nr:glycoside hydrolase family 88 protein [Formivibrio sp.]